MVAITHPAPLRPLLPLPDRPVTAATYRRRRLAAGALAVLLLVAAVVLASQLVGGSGAAELDRSRPVAELSVVVEPGDSVWSIAESLAGGDDVRPVVDAIVAANGGADLVVGERLVLVLPEG